MQQLIELLWGQSRRKQVRCWELVEPLQPRKLSWERRQALRRLGVEGPLSAWRARRGKQDSVDHPPRRCSRHWTPVLQKPRKQSRYKA